MLLHEPLEALMDFQEKESGLTLWFTRENEGSPHFLLDLRSVAENRLSL